MIPSMISLIEPLTARFPAAWAKAKNPHDDGEFNARTCAVLHYEHGLTNVGRNGKRGNPADLSKDVICWKGEGSNYDPTNGNAPVTIIDFIGAHEASHAHIIQIMPDPNGPGAWVKPLTLAEIDAGSPVPQPPVGKPYPGDQFFIEKLGMILEADYTTAGQRLNAGSSVWFSRTIWRHVNEGMTMEQSTAQSRVEWRAALGLPLL